jgi:hypothetical protein
MSKYPRRVRSAVAMRVVNLDRLKFNEAVANGYYTCAPITTAGSVRLFAEDDLVALYVFARLLELNVAPRRAGQLACEFKSHMRSRGNEAADRIIYVRGQHDDFFTTPKQYDPDHEKKNRAHTGIGRVVLHIEFYLSHIRSIIAEQIEYENSIMGTEGADD